MKLVFISLTMLAFVTFAAAEWQWQQSMSEELRETSSLNDELQWMVMKSSARMSRDSLEISALEAKLNAPAAGQATK